MRTIDDDILERFGDLIKEVPEALDALRDQEIARRKRVMAALAAKMAASAAETDRIRFEKLCDYFLSRGSGSHTLQ